MDEPDLKMATDDIGMLVAYLGEHSEVTSVLITGGGPMIMGEAVLRRYIGPLIDPRNRLDHLAAWQSMWRTQVRMGMVPYYMFVERDTRPQRPCGHLAHRP